MKIYRLNCPDLYGEVYTKFKTDKDEVLKELPYFKERIKEEFEDELDFSTEIILESIEVEEIGNIEYWAEKTVVSELIYDDETTNEYEKKYGKDSHPHVKFAK